MSENENRGPRWSTEADTPILNSAGRILVLGRLLLQRVGRGGAAGLAARETNQNATRRGTGGETIPPT